MYCNVRTERGAEVHVRASRGRIAFGAVTTLSGFGLAAILGAATPALAQLPDASGAALGLGDNYTALARGRNAVAWNPAGLGMPGGPSFSISFAPVRGVGAIGPITPKDLVDIGDRALTHSERVQWLSRISDAGSQRGNLGLDVTYLSLNIGRLGLQLSSSIDGTVDIGPDAAELLLFGNAGRTGAPRPFDLEGSALTMAATSTAALSYGHPISIIPGQDVAIGATLKYTVGHVLLHGRDAGSSFSVDPLGATITFPVIHTDTALESLSSGSGYGLDLGASWRSGPLEVGVAFHNVLNTFAWDESSFFFSSGSAMITADSTESEFDSHPIGGAPAEIRARAQEIADDFRYHPHLALGAAFSPLSALTVVGEVRHRRGDVISKETATHMGVGAELRPLPWIPIRGGYTLLSNGHQLSGGIGLEFGLINLQLSAARRGGDAGEGGLAMFVLSFGGR